MLEQYHLNLGVPFIIINGLRVRFPAHYAFQTLTLLFRKQQLSVELNQGITLIIIFQRIFEITL